MGCFLMSLDTILLVLRVAIAVAFYAFLGALLYVLWRDISSTLWTTDAEHRHFGHLTVVTSECEAVMVGQRFLLFPTTTLGRAPTNTAVLPDSFVSMEHARLTLQGNQWWLEDRGSKNGTLLNDIPVEEPVVLSSGDVIGVGRIKLQLAIDSR